MICRLAKWHPSDKREKWIADVCIEKIMQYSLRESIKEKLFDVIKNIMFRL